MAKQLAHCMLPFVAKAGHRRVPISQFANLLIEPYIHRRPVVCDGAGLNSNADHSNPKTSPLKPLSDALLQYLQGKGLVLDIASSLRQGSSEHPIPAHHRYELASIIHSTCAPTATTQTALPSVKDNPFACA